MIATVVVQRQCRCACGKVFDRNESIDLMQRHVAIAPNQCRIDQLFVCKIATERGQTKKQLERSLGVGPEIVGMMALDPPVGGLYYGWYPVWIAHVGWGGGGRAA